jgi:hypothetical protein
LALRIDKLNEFACSVKPKGKELCFPDKVYDGWRRCCPATPDAPEWWVRRSMKEDFQ